MTALQNHIRKLKQNYCLLQEQGRFNEAVLKLALFNIEIKYYNQLCAMYKLPQASTNIMDSFYGSEYSDN
jgi:hypothetical protein